MFNVGVGAMPDQNCWEVSGCGREEGGKRAGRLGVCPASTDRRLHGVHGGVNGGRTCWVIAGTFCTGEIAGSLAKKLDNCIRCEFYWRVRDEAGPSYQPTANLLQRIQPKSNRSASLELLLIKLEQQHPRGA
jgi:hypothetical protein